MQPCVGISGSMALNFELKIRLGTHCTHENLECIQIKNDLIRLELIYDISTE